MILYTIYNTTNTNYQQYYCSVSLYNHFFYANVRPQVKQKHVRVFHKRDYPETFKWGGHRDTWSHEAEPWQE